DHEFPAERRVGHEYGVAPGGVEEGHAEERRVLAAARRRQTALRPFGLEPAAHGDEAQAHEVAADVPVGAEGALGPPGGARRVEDGGVVLGIEGDIGQGGVGWDVADDVLEALVPLVDTTFAAG